MRGRDRECVTEVLPRHYGLSASPVGIRIGLWTAVICHCQAPPSWLPYGRPGGVASRRVGEEDDDEGRIEPSRIPRNTCRCLCSNPDRASLGILYTRARIYRETRNICAGINKAPYCVNYDRAACRRSRLCGMASRLSARRGSLTRVFPAFRMLYFPSSQLRHVSSSIVNNVVRAFNRT